MSRLNAGGMWTEGREIRWWQNEYNRHGDVDRVDDVSVCVCQIIDKLLGVDR